MVLSRSFTVLRVGDQVLFRNKDSNGWYTEGYYQLGEIASVFGGRMRAFTAFGRILTISPDEQGGYYRIPSELVKEFDVTGIPVRRKGGYHYLRVFPQLIYELRRTTARYDIQWFMLPSLAGLVGLLFTPRRGVRVAQLVGEWARPIQMKYPRWAYLAVPTLEWLTKIALSRADIAVFVSDYLRQKYGSNLKIHAIVANESRLRPWMITEVDRSEVHHPLRVLYAGRLVPEKGVQILIEAVAHVSKDIPCELWIAGSGPFESSLRQQARELGMENHVRWLGWIPWGQKLFELMHEADVLVLPSFPGIEGLPLVLLDAMSQSLPVIASATGGILEIIHDLETGLLFEPGNSEQLSECIRRVAVDCGLRLALVANGLEKARQNTFEATTGKVIEAMCELAQKKGLKGNL